MSQIRAFVRQNVCKNKWALNSELGWLRNVRKKLKFSSLRNFTWLIHNAIRYAMVPRKIDQHSLKRWILIKVFGVLIAQAIFLNNSIHSQFLYMNNMIQTDVEESVIPIPIQTIKLRLYVTLVHFKSTDIAAWII